MPDLLDTIDKAHIKGRFIKKPIGPIGDILITLLIKKMATFYFIITSLISISITEH